MTVRADIERREGAAGLEPIAIIGMACLFPQAPDLAAFWRNIVSRRRRRRRAGRRRGTRERYLRCRAHQDRVRRLPEGPVPLRSARVRHHAELARRRRARPVPRPARRPRRAGRRRLPATTTTIATPASSSATAPTCIAARAAILQNTLVLDQTIELLAAVLPHRSRPAQLAEIRALMQSKLPPCNADIAPGLVPNVMTGRIANRLNLQGPELPARRRLRVVAAGGRTRRSTSCAAAAAG